MKRRRVKKEIRNNERWVRKTKKIMRRQLQEFEEEQLKTKLRVIETINEGFKQAGNIIHLLKLSGTTNPTMNYLNRTNLLMCRTCCSEVGSPCQKYQNSKGTPVCNRCISRLITPIICPLCTKGTLEKISTQTLEQCQKEIIGQPRTTRSKNPGIWEMYFGGELRELFSAPKLSLLDEDEYYMSDYEEEDVQHNN